MEGLSIGLLSISILLGFLAIVASGYVSISLLKGKSEQRDRAKRVYLLRSLPFIIAPASLGIAAALAPDNKTLVLASTIVFSISALIVLLFFLCALSSLICGRPTYDDDEIGLMNCFFTYPRCFLPGLIIYGAGTLCSCILYTGRYF